MSLLKEVEKEMMNRIFQALISIYKNHGQSIHGEWQTPDGTYRLDFYRKKEGAENEKL